MKRYSVSMKLKSLNRRATNGLRLQGQASSSMKAGVLGTLTGSISGTMFNTFKYVEKSFIKSTQELKSDTLYGWRQALNWGPAAVISIRVSMVLLVLATTAPSRL